ncbi:MAG: NFACT RNA binding domain-containing protein, partial [candidate division Zixibacteria bacterium]|nr:NFACT RNA binding domain-containing protein [candidate division Zixibacteria bacterium]
ESHKPLKIELDRALSPQENIESYFKKFRKGREGGELLKRRLEITRNEYEEILKILTDLEFNFNLARERYSSEINSILPKTGNREVIALRLPYKEYQLSTGLTIFVGRDGSDNDRTTFDYAKPYELWFHTQQCPGSHVVMKYPNKSFEPSKREIEETAAIAAFHSKARNDSLVPVVYTERKYVRKPKKAKPGLVMVEREKSIMVTPKKPE